MGLSSQIFLVSKRQAGESRRERETQAGRERERQRERERERERCSPWCPQGGTHWLSKEPVKAIGPVRRDGVRHLLLFHLTGLVEGFQWIPGRRVQ